MNTDELVSGVVEGLNLEALDLSGLVRALVVLLIGVLVIRVVMNAADRALERSKTMRELKRPIRTAAKALLWFVLILVAADSLGIKVTSLIALLSVAGLAVSLALQSILANLAGGIVLLAAKPFEAGDYVEADGVSGTVTAVGLFYSTLSTPDNKEIFIPNSQISSAKIINYNRLGTRRLELVFSAGYDAPAGTVRAAIQEAMEQFPEILSDPAPAVWLSKYGSSSIEYVVRAWVPAEAYWDVYYGLNEAVGPAFARHGVEMTYDHLNVHLVEK